MPFFWTIEVSLGRSVGWLTNYHDPPKDKLIGCEFKGRPPGPLTQIYQQCVYIYMYTPEFIHYSTYIKYSIYYIYICIFSIVFIIYIYTHLLCIWCNQWNQNAGGSPEVDFHWFEEPVSIMILMVFYQGFHHVHQLHSTCRLSIPVRAFIAYVRFKTYHYWLVHMFSGGIS